MDSRRLLFVSHDAGRTGAPFLLLHLLRWLRRETNVELTIVLKQTGPLQDAFAELGRVLVFPRRWPVVSGRISRFRPVGDFGYALNKSTLRRAVARRTYDAIYSNTLVNGTVLQALPVGRCPLISHAHELEYMLAMHTTVRDLAYTLEQTDALIAGSDAVAVNLTARHGFNPELISVIREFIPISARDSSQHNRTQARLRSELGIAPGAFVVCAAGTLDWRKGADVFVLLAAAVRAMDPQNNTHFVWIGGGAEAAFERQVVYDVEKIGLGDRMHFLGQRSDYLDYMALGDVFCLMSREDPFPLVVLEAASLAKPILCFAGSGGSPEFVEDDCGFIVPYLDVAGMAARIAELRHDPELASRLGNQAAFKVDERNNVLGAAPAILEVIERAIFNGKRSG